MSEQNQEGQHQRAFAIILCLFLAYMWKETVWDPYFQPAAPRSATSAPAVQQNAAPTASSGQASSAAVNDYAEPVASNVTGNTPAVGASPQKLYPTDGQVRSSGLLEIATPKFNASISRLGGRIVSLVLREYEANEVGSPHRLNLVEHIEGAPFPLGIYSGAVNDAWVNYQVVSGPSVGLEQAIAAGEQSSVVLEGKLEDGRKITKTITFNGENYFVDVNVQLAEGPADGSRLSLEWTKLIAKDSPTLLDPYMVSGYVWFDGQKALRVAFSDLESDIVNLTNIVWLAVADKYFMAALVSADGNVEAKALKTGQLYRARLFGTTTQKSARLYLGPKSYKLLGESGYELRRVIDFGWSGIIAAPLLSLLHLFYGMFSNYGLAIVALTILVKMALYPLTSSSFRQMKALQDLAPDMKRIRETITDKQQQQLELMNLYKDKGVNPLGGCLPMFLQMPVFIGLYSALLVAIELRHAPFAFWIHDLSAPEKLMISGSFGIPILVVLFVISMLGQQLTTPTSADPMQKRMMLAMPIVFGFMFSGMPAGLTLYWLTNNLISIGQQVALRRDDGRHGVLITLGVAAVVFMFAFVLVKLG